MSNKNKSKNSKKDNSIAEEKGGVVSATSPSSLPTPEEVFVEAVLVSVPTDEVPSTISDTVSNSTEDSTNAEYVEAIDISDYYTEAYPNLEVCYVTDHTAPKLPFDVPADCLNKKVPCTSHYLTEKGITPDIVERMLKSSIERSIVTVVSHYGIAQVESMAGMLGRQVLLASDFKSGRDLVSKVRSLKQNYTLDNARSIRSNLIKQLTINNRK